MQGQAPNYRHLSRPAKFKNAEEVFLCQCGKSYLSFPSLYLHFQKKHFMAISTKGQNGNRLVKKQRGKTTITYYFSNKKDIKSSAIEQNQNEQETGEKNTQLQAKNYLLLLKRITDQYAFQARMQNKLNVEQNLLQLTLEKIYYYTVRETMKKERGFFSEINLFKVSLLPCIFNPFIKSQTFNLHCEIGDLQIIQMCEVLQGLAGWMKEKGYTDLRVQYCVNGNSLQ